MLRHGQTDWNRLGRYQGRTDVPLSAAGLDQAQRAGAALRHTPVSVLVTSPLGRARATAQVISRILGVIPCELDDRLIELSFGEWEGLSQAEIKQRWPERLREWKRAPHTFRFPGGECLHDGLRRLQDFLRDLPCAARERPGCILAVTHAGPIRLAALLAQQRPLSHYRQVQPPANAALQFDWEPGGPLRAAAACPLT